MFLRENLNALLAILRVLPVGAEPLCVFPTRRVYQFLGDGLFFSGNQVCASACVQAILNFLRALENYLNGIAFTFVFLVGVILSAEGRSSLADRAPPGAVDCAAKLRKLQILVDVRHIGYAIVRKLFLEEICYAIIFFGLGVVEGAAANSPEPNRAVGLREALSIWEWREVGPDHVGNLTVVPDV